MDPIKLQIENFGPHSKGEIDFTDFSSALIIGKVKGNEKFSNGVGKSTIFSAIKYVLFNEINVSTLDRVIRHGTDFCKVTFDFSVSNTDIYRIVRSRSRKTGSEVLLFKKEGDSWKSITGRRNPDTEKDIAKIIKINYKTFCNSVLFSQSDLSGLASLTPADKKKVLKEVLQLNVYSKYEAAAKKKTSDLIKEVEKTNTILLTFGNPEQDINSFTKEQDEINTIIDSKNELLFSLKNNQNKGNEKYFDLSKKFDALEQSALESETKQKILQNEIRNISSSLTEYNSKNMKLNNALHALNIELSKIELSISNNIKFEVRSRDLIQNDINIITKKIIENKAKQNSLSSELTELKIPLQTGKNCLHCRQKISIDIKSCQSSIDENIKNIEFELRLMQIDTTELEKNIIKLNYEYKHGENLEKLINNEKQNFNMKLKEIEAAKSMQKEFTALLQKNSQELSLKELELQEQKKNQFSKNDEDYISLKLQISNTKAKLLKLNNELDELSQVIISLSNNKAILSHKIEQRVKDIVQIESYKSDLLKLKYKHVIQQKAIQAFGSTGIPALIIHTILDDYQIETNTLLSQLRPGLQVQFSVIKDKSNGDKDDTLDIIYLLNGHELEYSQLSGAQQFIASLALKLGLASVIKNRLGVDIKLLLIDEVDQSLDEGSLEAYESAIKHLQKDFKILVITHNNELKTKFNNAILVEQDENFVSTVKVVNTW